MIDRKRLRVWWDALLYTAFTGTDSAPKRSAALRRLRGLAIVGCGLWAAFITFSTVSASPPVKAFNVVVTAVPCFLAVRSSLWGWRALILGLTITPLTLTGMVESWGWPWSPGFALTAALVLYLVGESTDQTELTWAALISLGAVTPFLRDWRDAALLVVLGGILFFVGNTVRQRRLAEEERVAQQERRIAEETRATLLEERAGIARELHDVVAHHMSVLALRADSARFRFAGPEKAELDDGVWREFADLALTAREGLTELRRLLGVLRAGDGELPVVPQPGLAGVVKLVEGVEATGTRCELELHGDLDDVPVGVALSVFRIAQEALSNAIRHAPGAPVSVELAKQSGFLRLVVHNGPGNRPKRTEQARGGHGLMGMRERAAMLAADLEVGERPDGGFRVALIVPLDREGQLKS
ncbi:histidine kinase [Amycolatopsis orientalis]|uniref:histidine kinase n=1 Tax=Amycolatopsis orientalis TaxID=31958 RepID=A0A193C1I1_AMYOR|nr:histidine kinase [Amycolatopsis orientalis]ANN18258.1 histidine kinase [Amycolatopsis orientalis]